MSSHYTLARPYARAAFESGRAGSALSEWSGQLAFAAGVIADRRIQNLIGSPKVEHQQLLALFLPEGMSTDSTFARFIGELADNGRLTVLAEIAELFEQLRAEAEKRVKVKVRSAAEIPADQRTRLADALKRRLGREVELDVTLDPSLLGGAVIDAGGNVTDGSLRAKLDQLGTALGH